MLEQHNHSSTTLSSILEPLDRGFFRLLHLQPTKTFDAPLIATIFPVKSDQNPLFEALSYASNGAFEGQSLPNGHLSLNGHNISIKGNLRDALHRLRRKDRARVLWVDAICLDQNNPLERSEHVAGMAALYNAASQVIIWVGEDSAQGDGKAFVRLLGTDTIESPPASKPWWKRLKGVRSHKQESLNEEQTLAKFYGRSYFSRKWTVIEAEASKQALLVCGPYEIQWTSTQRRLLPRMLNERRGQVPFDVLQLLHETSNLRCHDERDHIFSIASLLHRETGCPAIVINYTLPWPQVFTDFARGFARANRLADTWLLLHVTAFQLLEHRERRCAELPSWVPDFRLDIPRLVEFEQAEWFREDLPVARSESMTFRDSTLGLSLAYYGVLGTQLLLDYQERGYQADDVLYGLRDRLTVVKYRQSHPSALYENVHGWDLMVLRPCNGGHGGDFTMVGPFHSTEERDERMIPKFLGMHNILIR